MKEDVIAVSANFFNFVFDMSEVPDIQIQVEDSAQVMDRHQKSKSTAIVAERIKKGQNGVSDTKNLCNQGWSVNTG